MPAISPDGNTIAFANYSSRGFDIHLMDNKPVAWKIVANYQSPYPTMKYAKSAVRAERSAYNPIPTLRPHLWLPIFAHSAYSGGLAGLFTFGSDAVQRHSYAVSALYGPSEQRFWYDINYQYDGFMPTLKFRMQDVDVTHSDLLVPRTGVIYQQDYVERSEMLDASATFELDQLEQEHALSVGYRRKILSSLTQVPPRAGYDGVIPGQGVLASSRVSYFFQNAKRYGYSISPEGGRSIEVGYEKFDKKIGSDFNINKTSIDWHEYIDFPFDHHVLLLRGYVGKASGDVLAQGAFQLGGDNPGDVTINVTDTNVHLRGYPANEYRGQKVGLLSTEYRFPIKNIERGGGNTPFFFKRVHGAVFVEAGNAWDGAYASKELKKSVGAEARLDMTLSYFLPITVRVGLAKALDDKKDTVAMVSIWARF